MIEKEKISLECVDVPDWAKYLTVDNDGDVFTHEGLPIQHEENGKITWERGDYRWCEYLAKTDPKHFGLYLIATIEITYSDGDIVIRKTINKVTK